MGACKNPHGFGFAIDTGDGIISERSMSAKKSIARFLELREQYPNGYAMWHARYATHGVKNELNCHPFKVVGKYDTYLAHNGVLDIHIPKDDKRSDTRIMAEELLPRLGGVSALDDDYVYDMISSWASGNKVVVMTNDPSAQYKIYIINESLGSWDDNGIWWSNNSYKSTLSTPRTTDYNYAYGNEPSVYDIVATDSHLDPSLYEQNKFECPSCEALVDLWENEYYCQMCDSCFECEANFLECLCYNPKNKNMILDEYGYLNNKWYSKEPLDF
jgi:glutamine amidotransferase